MKRIIVLILIVFAVIQASAQKAEIFSPGGIAIKGYDAVAFFKQSKPVKGIEKFSYQWNNATWLFSDEENRAAFEKTPEKYAPQYGGYCAFGASEGHKAPTETDTWTVRNDKLYFNYNKKVKEMWQKDEENLIKIADQKWPEIKNAE